MPVVKTTITLSPDHWWVTNGTKLRKATLGSHCAQSLQMKWSDTLPRCLLYERSPTGIFGVEIGLIGLGAKGM